MRRLRLKLEVVTSSLFLVMILQSPKIEVTGNQTPGGSDSTGNSTKHHGLAVAILQGGPPTRTPVTHTNPCRIKSPRCLGVMWRRIYFHLNHGGCTYWAHQRNCTTQVFQLSHLGLRALRGFLSEIWPVDLVGIEIHGCKPSFCKGIMQKLDCAQGITSWCNKKCVKINLCQC